MTYMYKGKMFLTEVDMKNYMKERAPRKRKDAAQEKGQTTLEPLPEKK